MSRVFGITNLLILGFLIIVILFVVAGLIVFVFYAVRGKRKREVNYVSAPEPVSQQQEEIRKTIGETLKELRTERNMTQEFVAENLGVSRQAVSKWENGTSEPSTTNLIAIAKLYGIEPEELLKKII